MAAGWRPTQGGGIPGRVLARVTRVVGGRFGPAGSRRAAAVGRVVLVHGVVRVEMELTRLRVKVPLRENWRELPGRPEKVITSE